MVDKPIYATHYRTNASKRPPHGTHPGVLFFMKAGRIWCKRPLSKHKCDKRPGSTVNAPPIIFLSKWPKAKLASPLSVRDGAVSQTSKGMLKIRNLMLGMWVGTYFAQQQQIRQNQTRTENRTCFRRTGVLVTQPVERVPC